MRHTNRRFRRRGLTRRGQRDNAADLLFCVLHRNERFLSRIFVMTDSVSQAESKSEVSACYDAFRMAGELFGRIQAAVGFGELTMTQASEVVAYTWTFNMSRSASERLQRYACQWNVRLSEFSFLRSLQIEAEEIAEQWKNEHRKLSS